MSIRKLIRDHQEATVTDGNGKSIIKIFGKDIFEDLKENIAVLDDTKEAEARNFVIDATSQRVRELMRADNFSVLCGAGSSIDLGGVFFSKSALEDNGWVKDIFTGDPDLLSDYKKLKSKYEDKIKKDDYGVEDFITFLFRLEYSNSMGYAIPEKVSEIKKNILSELKKKCLLPDKADKDKIIPYKTFIKRILSRPVNLRRTNLFTTNYDLVFETAMDGLGVVYVDGFIGGLKSFFHPESFNFDFYYPASTTEGNVSRMERVLHYYKIHGSLNWVESAEDSFLNIYGLEKKDTELLGVENVLVYPTPMKEHDTIGFPYSELFRKFANIIQQQQSVLITYGYSFGDSHINRLILEALTIPSFQLLIISYSWSDNIKKIYRRFKDEPSVGFIIGPEFANWTTFVSNILPDLPTQDLEEKYQQKRNKAKDVLKTLK